MAIDTHAYVKTLEKAGMTRDLAEAHLEALQKNVWSAQATKQDLTELKIQLILAMFIIISFVDSVLFFALKGL